MCIVTGAAYLGNAGPNIEALATARGAAYGIFEIIDQVRNI